MRSDDHHGFYSHLNEEECSNDNISRTTEIIEYSNEDFEENTNSNKGYRKMVKENR
jgi:hypothetical protein